MSIIYDALKKVEETHRPEDKKNKPKYKTYLLYTLVLCAGLIIAGISFNFFTFFYNNLSKSEWDGIEKQNITVSPEVPNELSKAAPPSPAPAPSFPDIKKQLESSLVLNGVFFSGNEGYALINNQIVEEGDIVNGAIVKEIGLDEVRLEFQDSVFILSGSKPR